MAGTTAARAGAPPPHRRIGFDARYLSHGLVGGVHTYVRNLLLALARVDPGRGYVLYADDKAPFELTDLPGTFALRRLPWRSGASSIAHDLRLGRAMARDGVALAHAPANYGFAPPTLPLVITLHDAINLLPLREILQDDSKTPRHIAMMTYLHLMTIIAVRRDPFVITDSHYSRQEILAHAPLAPERVRVIYPAHDRAFRLLDPGEPRDLRRRLGLRPRVLVADAIKNGGCTLRAYRALPSAVRARTSLVFFARRPPIEEVRAAAAAGECLLLPRPPREELIALYNLADLFIYPSWYEGFGLPILEAMACGTPVIGSSRGSIPEIVGDGGEITGAEDHRAIAAAITTLLGDDARHAQLRAAALARAARFTWDETARQTLETYDEVLDRARAGRPLPRGARTAHPAR